MWRTRKLTKCKGRSCALGIYYMYSYENYEHWFLRSNCLGANSHFICVIQLFVVCSDSSLLNGIGLLVVVNTTLPPHPGLPLLLSSFRIVCSHRRQRSSITLLLNKTRRTQPFSACLVAPGLTQTILSVASLDCVIGFKPPEIMLSILLHLGAGN